MSCVQVSPAQHFNHFRIFTLVMRREKPLTEPFTRQIDAVAS